MESKCLHVQQGRTRRFAPPPGHVGPWLAQILYWEAWPGPGVRWQYHYEWIGPGEPEYARWRAHIIHGPCMDAELVYDPMGPDFRAVRRRLAPEGGELDVETVAEPRPRSHYRTIALIEFLVREGELPVRISLSCDGSSCEAYERTLKRLDD